MFNFLPPTLRRLLNLLPKNQATHPTYPQFDQFRDWQLYYFSQYTLRVPLETAKQLMQGGAMPPRYRYRHFYKPKKDGSLREIAEPGPDLKRAQHLILKHIRQRRFHAHPSALGFRRKKSIADHAWAHAGADIIITADIKDFFPSTTRQRVKAWWHQQGYSTWQVRLLTALTTYRGVLPQGAPTSPPLSNLVNADLDAEIEKRVKVSGGVYTRYADDLAFSWRNGAFPPADFEQAIRSLLRAYGYQLHPTKGWHVWRRADEPEITGLTLTRRGKVEVSQSMLRIMRALEKSTAEVDQQRLAGYRGFRQMVETPPKARAQASPNAQSAKSQSAKSQSNNARSAGRLKSRY